VFSNKHPLSPAESLLPRNQQTQENCMVMIWKINKAFGVIMRTNTKLPWMKHSKRLFGSGVFVSKLKKCFTNSKMSWNLGYVLEDYKNLFNFQMIWNSENA
jgi:hypothetical protein